jgi:glycosyltransferase involved in cell wall biosynthesis
MSGGLHLLQMVTVRWYNACAEYAIRVSLGLAERGHRVVVGGFRGSPVLEVARSAGLPVVDAFDFRPGLVVTPSTITRFRRYIAESQFDLVNAHRSEDHVFAALALARRPRVPLVRTRGDVRKPRTNWLNRILYEKLTDAHILTAGFMRQGFYKGFRLGSDRLATILPGFDVDRFRRGAPERSAARELLGLPRNSRVIGVIGRLTTVKGHLVALEAFSRVHRHYPEARFVIAGRPADIPAELLRERAHHLGLGSSLLVKTDVEDVRSVMAALDIGVIASTASEAICRVALEYGALGIPVVGTDVNSIPEIVRHGTTGLIVAPADPEAMAASIQRFLGSPALMEKLGDLGPGHIRNNYSLNRMMETTEAVYRLLIRVQR